jgi:hypothetical protein
VVGAFVGSYRIRPAPSYLARSPSWAVVAKPSGKRCGNQRQHDTCVRAGYCTSASTRARIRGPAHACPLGHRGGALSPGPCPAPGMCRRFREGVALCLGSRRRPSAPETRPGSIFNAPARALPFLLGHTVFRAGFSPTWRLLRWRVRPGLMGHGPNIGSGREARKNRNRAWPDITKGKQAEKNLPSS